MDSQRPSTSSQNDTQHSRYSFESRDRYMVMKNLLSETNNIENKTINPMEMIEMTKEIVKETNLLFSTGSREERVQHPSENFLDSQLLRASSDVIVRCSESIGSNLNKYDKNELADHIKRNNDFWEFTFPNEAPPVAYLYGTFAPTPLPPRVPVRHTNTQRQQGHFGGTNTQRQQGHFGGTNTQRQQAAAPKVPMKPDNVVKRAEEGSPEMAAKLYRSLKSICKDGPVSYFHVVLDPTSFSRTVENVYHLSFLACDGRISVYLDEAAGVPLVNIVSHHKRRRAENSSEKQFIISLDMERWRDLIEAFNVKEPMLKLE